MEVSSSRDHKIMDASKRLKQIVVTISKKLNDEKKETLKRKLQELEVIEASMNSRLENIKHILSERLKNEVGCWLTNVGRIKKEAQSMHKELEESKWTMQFAGYVKRIIEEVRELIDQKGRLEMAFVTDADQTNHEAFLTKRWSLDLACSVLLGFYVFKISRYRL